MDVDEYDDENVSARGVECRRETEKALHCYQNGEDFWIPKSQVSPESEVSAKDDNGTLIMTKWLARQEGWYDED